MTDNNGLAEDDCGGQCTPPIDDDFRAGLALLWQAYRYAHDAGADLWDFALESEILHAANLTISDLRWLVAKGLAEHGLETSFYGDPHRSFRPGRGLKFAPTTCFVLTPEGAGFAGRVLRETDAAGREDTSPPGPCP